MTEERTEYMTPGEVADKLLRQEQCIAQLESANDGYNLIQRRHAETIAAQADRIAELEATVLRQLNTIARLQQDNRRLRHLDAMPVDAIRRLVEYCEWTQSEEYPVNQHIADYDAAIAHFRKMDGDA